MGYMRHHSIIVSGWNEECVLEAHRQAKEVFGKLVSGLVNSNINHYRAFFVAPDGSKEGWEDSNEGDRKRAEYKLWLKKKCNGKDFFLEWVEVQYADDESQTLIVDDSDAQLR